MTIQIYWLIWTLTGLQMHLKRKEILFYGNMSGNTTEKIMPKS